MNITQPATMITDYVLAAAGFVFGVLLLPPRGAKTRLLWTIGMFTAAVAAARLGRIFVGYDISPDDLRYARSVAKTFGVDYHEQLLEPRIVDLLPRLVHHLDDPVADPAAVTTYLICSAASERQRHGR